MTDRERFMAVLYTSPLVPTDAVCVLSGDGEGRLEAGIALMAGGGAPRMVLSGGVDRPPFSLLGSELARRAIGKGVDPTRLVVENESRNTREQAERVLDLAAARGWHSLLLVASPFHLPRAFLTFVGRLAEMSQIETFRIVPVAASQLKWWQVPDGMTQDRLALLADEAAKIEEYGARGHVAGYVAGLDYLRRWEA